MKHYIVRWYDVTSGKEHIKDITAIDLPAAKHKAFQMLCDNSGDNLVDDVSVYEYRYTFRCKGEPNPKPNGCNRAFAKRDYYTGMKIRRGGKDNG
jgi:hypothetical protein